MKTIQQSQKALLLCTALLLIFSNRIFSQSWLLAGNANVASGTQYLGTKDANDLTFRTNAIERGRVLGAGGAWRFGTATNFAKIDSTGKLSFGGTGKYVVAGNKYVFQYATTPNYGLFFNSTTPQYEFRNSAATSVFTVNAATGASKFAGALTIGAYTLPATDGVSGQVLKTNGSGTVSWGSVASNYWSLTGNAGTSPSSNFIGTTDNAGFSIRTNNLDRIRVGFNGNVGIGTVTPKTTLQVIGTTYASLTGDGYVLLGDTSNYNMVMDLQQVQARYNGSASTLFLNNNGGTTQIGNGSSSYQGVLAAASDFGVYAYATNGTGVYGQGTNNGYGGYFYNSSGIGVYGYDAGTGIGHGVYGYEVGGGEGVDGFAYGGGGWGVEAYSSQSYGLYASTSSGSYAGYFNGSVLTSGSYVTSDEKLKQNIQDFSGAMDIIGKLHPRQYKFRQDGSYKLMNLPLEQQYGLIAQDVEKLLPGLVKETKFDVDKASNNAPQPALDPKNKNAQPIAAPKKTGEVIDYKALNYTALIPIMIKGMQEQQAIIDKQQQQIDELKTMVTALTQGGGISSAAKSSTVGAILSSAALEQNVPNPLNNSTSIRYYVPAGSGNASINIADQNGKAIKQIALQTGSGNITIDASTLSAGAYSYTLIIDGKTITTKKMMVAR